MGATRSIGGGVTERLSKDPIRLFTVRESSPAPPVQRPGAGWWSPEGAAPQWGSTALAEAIRHVGRPVYVLDSGGDIAVADRGSARIGAGDAGPDDGAPLLAYAPALLPGQLGDPIFSRTHGLKYPYVAGAMANGIASEQLVEAMGRAGMIGFFGAAGLDLRRVEAAIDRLESARVGFPFGFNLIHSPNEPLLEAQIVDLYIRRGVRTVSASAYIDLTLPLIRYRVSGIHRGPSGAVVTPNRVVAKVSRVEVARRFFSPPPDELLQRLVRGGDISAEQARMAGEIPVADDLTAEADSGGHTDNRPLITLLPTMLALRDQLQAKFGYLRPLLVGAAGGIATPAAAAAAFALGAAYVLTGTVNQSCREAGTSPLVRRMLAEAEQADVAMAAAADMFEMGVKVQVLKRGTMFPVRARKLYELYRAYNRLEALPAATREQLERDYFRGTIDEAWARTRDYFATRDPAQIERAEADPKHKMALVFRSYLGQSSNWANQGEPSRKIDYQVWCGPAMGAFNEWARGSFLESAEQRDVVTVAMNLLVGAAALTRANWLRAQGVPLPPQALSFAPQPLAGLEQLVQPVPQEATL